MLQPLTRGAARPWWAPRLGSKGIPRHIMGACMQRGRAGKAPAVGSQGASFGLFWQGARSWQATWELLGIWGSGGSISPLHLRKSAHALGSGVLLLVGRIRVSMGWAGGARRRGVGLRAPRLAAWRAPACQKGALAGALRGRRAGGRGALGSVCVGAGGCVCE
ncbi:MAG: hypothetical protein J3K34DRAFT_432181 [Monoraphidium minutum]|nr:MAG: hypothetical protein J3K34DRAFT_432181 [Monoraphidium minutum]